ncbi:hypothetical protein MYK68_01305 [Gordonia sp. PP30]|uniref:hypothetical protein n=1 Tax=Gordonia sp. PP30 TaxID=2935861 RepID=UPI001FFFF7A6|nr:hypothetical protein [Gordonia sp. PP30]UQE75306.1 hypothetical protein MYK68_01305 [Gordonia sp. PP30]
MATLVACGGGDDGRQASSTKPRPAPDVPDGSVYLTSLDDLPPRELVGLTANTANKRMFTDKYRGTQVGDGRVRNFGDIAFSTEQLNLTKPLVPDRGTEFTDYTGDYRIVAACTTRNAADGSYALYVGILPKEIATDELIAKGRAGEWTPVMDRNTPCSGWGPTLPLSGMK